MCLFRLSFARLLEVASFGCCVQLLRPNDRASAVPKDMPPLSVDPNATRKILLKPAAPIAAPVVHPSSNTAAVTAPPALDTGKDARQRAAASSTTTASSAGTSHGSSKSTPGSVLPLVPSTPLKLVTGRFRWSVTEVEQVLYLPAVDLDNMSSGLMMHHHVCASECV